MNRQDLQTHQARLQKRSAALRLQAAAELRQLEPAFAMGDRLVQAGMWVRRNPAYLLGALALLVVIKPRAALRATVRGWSWWQNWQNARRWITRAR